MSKPRRYNPWAICTASVGRMDKAKYERCVKKVKALYGYKNPAISAVWPKMTSRQRWAAMEFAGIGEDRARALSHEDWIYLPEDVKSAFLRYWQSGFYGSTKRRLKGETTRRMPVLTNPVAKPFQVQGSHTYLLTFKGGGWHIYEGYDSHADALDMAKWLMQRGVAGVKGPVQTLILKPVNERRYTVFYRSARRVASNNAGGAMEGRAREVIRKAEAALGSLTFNAKVNLLLDNLSGLRNAQEAAALLSRLGYRKNGTKGPYPFSDKQRQYRAYTVPQLRFALKDAAETARIWKGQDPATENWYRDDVFTISDEIRRREGVAMKNPTAPIWMQSEAAFYKKFGTVPQRLSQALSRLTDAQKKEFHRRAEKTISEDAVRWALREGGMGSLENSGTQELPVEGGKLLMSRAVKFLRRRGVKARLIEVERGRYRVRVGAGHDVRKLTKLVDQGPWKHDDRLALTPRQIKKFEAHGRRHGPISRPGELAYWAKSRLRQAAHPNPVRGLTVYYVAKYRPAYPRKGEFWTASTVIDALPPTVVGKLFKIAARTKKDAIREAQKAP